MRILSCYGISTDSILSFVVSSFMVQPSHSNQCNPFTLMRLSVHLVVALIWVFYLSLSVNSRHSIRIRVCVVARSGCCAFFPVLFLFLFIINEFIYWNELTIAYSTERVCCLFFCCSPFSFLCSFSYRFLRLHRLVGFIVVAVLFSSSFFLS